MKYFYTEIIIKPQAQEEIDISKIKQLHISSSGRFKCCIYDKNNILYETGFISFSGFNPFINKKYKKLTITSMDNQPCYVYISGRK